jgi:hypothetical protein
MHCLSKTSGFSQATIIVSLCALGGFARDRGSKSLFNFITNEPKILLLATVAAMK